MAEAKLVVIYPRPKEIEAFEKIYMTEHVPMAVEKLIGKTRIVATKITASPQGTPASTGSRRFIFPQKQRWRHARLHPAHRKHWRTPPRFHLVELR